MSKIGINDLSIIKNNFSQTINLRENNFNIKITVYMGTCGIAKGARNIIKILIDELKKSDRNDIIITISDCLGICNAEPLISIKKKNEAPVKYFHVNPSKIRHIFKNHILDGNIQKQWVLNQNNHE